MRDKGRCPGGPDVQPPTRSSARGTRGHLPSPHLHHFVHCSVFDSDRHVGTPWWHPSPPPPPNTCVQSNLLPVPPPIGPYARPTSGGSDVCRCGVRGSPWRCPSAPPVLCCPISRCNISGLGGAEGCCGWGSHVCSWGALLGVAFWQLSSVLVQSALSHPPSFAESRGCRPLRAVPSPH